MGLGITVCKSDDIADPDILTRIDVLSVLTACHARHSSSLMFATNEASASLNNIQRRAVALGVLFLLAVADAQTKLIDEALLDKLEQAHGRDQLDVARTIEQRLQEGRAAPATEKRLVELLTHSPTLVKAGQVRMLHHLGPGAELDEATITAVAKGLSSTVVPQATGAIHLSRLLIDYNTTKRLPDAAIAHLYEGLKQPTVSAKPAHVIHVLQTIPTSDQRYIENTKAIGTALQLGTTHVRMIAAKALALYGAQAELPLVTVSRLTDTALADSHIHIRIEAFAALSGQPKADKKLLTTAFVRELTEPTEAIWQASSGFTQYHESRPRAISLLMSWFEAPYPGDLLDALIAQTKRHFQTTFPYLETAIRHGGFSPQQRQALDTIATRHDNAQQRQQIFRLLDDGKQPPVINDVLATFEHGRSKANQLRAGYRLQRHYDAQVPAAVGEVAERVILTSKHRELRDLAAALLTQSEIDIDLQEQALLLSLRKKLGDGGVASAWTSLYPDEQLEAAVTKYVADDSLVSWERKMLVDRLAKLAQPEQLLRPETVQALTDAAAATDSYSLNNAILVTLQAWRATVPLSVRFNNKGFQATALTVAYVALALVFIAGSIVNLVIAITMPLQANGRTAKRIALCCFWLILTVVGLGLFAIAFVGFIGHNSAPSPRRSVGYHVPMYIGMVVFIVYTSINLIHMRRRIRRSRDVDHVDPQAE